MATSAVAPALFQRNRLGHPSHTAHTTSNSHSAQPTSPSTPSSSSSTSTAAAAAAAQTPSSGAGPVDVSSVDKHAYLFGANLKASLSPYLHEVIYRNMGLNWAQFPLDSLDMPQFLRLIRDPSFYGSSVTMPHKVAIMPHLDWVTPECAQVGACNTIFLRPDPAENPSSGGGGDGKQQQQQQRRRLLLCGANTDVSGVRDAFLRNIPDPSVWKGKPALVLGGGGAARSAVYALWRYMDVADIYVANRDPKEADDLVAECRAKGFGDRVRYVATVEEARALDPPGAVVACVPDYPPRTEGELLARKVLEELMGREGAERGVMLEMCYNPTPYTKLGALVEKMGWKVILGTEALIYQGLEQDMYWTGKSMEELPVKAVHEAIAEKVAERAREHKEMNGFYF